MRKNTTPVVAICYDFDGTLSPGNMQEYGFLPGLGEKAKSFWAESNELARKEKADPILTYMLHIIEKAEDANIGTTKSDFKSYGKNVKLFDGVRKWFKRINKYGATKGICIKHYIVSSGLREIIEGTTIGTSLQRYMLAFTCIIITMLPNGLQSQSTIQLKHNFCFVSTRAFPMMLTTRR